MVTYLVSGRSYKHSGRMLGEASTHPSKRAKLRDEVLVILQQMVLLDGYTQLFPTMLVRLFGRAIFPLDNRSDFLQELLCLLKAQPSTLSQQVENAAQMATLVHAHWHDVVRAIAL